MAGRAALSSASRSGRAQLRSLPVVRDCNRRSTRTSIHFWKGFNLFFGVGWGWGCCKIAFEIAHTHAHTHIRVVCKSTHTKHTHCLSAHTHTHTHARTHARTHTQLCVSTHAHNTIEYNRTLLPSVNTLIAQGMFSGAKYAHHTFTPIIKHLITANKHPGKKSFIDKNMKNPTGIKLCISHKTATSPGPPLKSYCPNKSNYKHFIYNKLIN